MKTLGAPHILFVNPWIHDFAAYDYWARPMGLLYLAAIARNRGYKVSFIDCLDRFHPRGLVQKENEKGPKRSKSDGRGPYLKTEIPHPPGLEHIPRTFSRYGIKPEWFLKDLAELPRPDLVLVTSLMTYWYPGVAETIAMIRRVFPKVPIILGGIYATLCREHAVAHAGADLVIEGNGAEKILEILSERAGDSKAWPQGKGKDIGGRTESGSESFLSARKPGFDPADLSSYPYPAFDLQNEIPYVPLLTSQGCPFSCEYCASNVLNPTPMTRSAEDVVSEIRFWHERLGVVNFAFYDDALLMSPERHIMPILERIIHEGLSLRFHTPNALHIRQISPRLARLMRRAGFETLRLGLETTRFNHREKLDRKVNREQFQEAVASLLAAGFKKPDIGAYLLVGLPGQQVEDVAESIGQVKKAGVTPVLAHYSPIPRTGLWESAAAVSPYDLKNDPIFSNNAIFPCRREGFSWKTLSWLKQLAAS